MQKVIYRLGKLNSGGIVAICRVGSPALIEAVLFLLTVLSPCWRFYFLISH